LTFWDEEHYTKEMKRRHMSRRINGEFVSLYGKLFYTSKIEQGEVVHSAIMQIAGAS